MIHFTKWLPIFKVLHLLKPDSYDLPILQQKLPRSSEYIVAGIEPRNE